MGRTVREGRWLFVAALILVPVAGAALNRTEAGGTIHACYSKSGGALRIAKSSRFATRKNWPLSSQRRGRVRRGSRR